MGGPGDSGTSCTTRDQAAGGGASVPSVGMTEADADPGETASGGAALSVASVVGAAGPSAWAEIPSAVACAMSAVSCAPPSELAAAGCGTAAASSEKTAASIWPASPSRPTGSAADAGPGPTAPAHAIAPATAHARARHDTPRGRAAEELEGSCRDDRSKRFPVLRSDLRTEISGRNDPEPTARPVAPGWRVSIPPSGCRESARRPSIAAPGRAARGARPRRRLQPGSRRRASASRGSGTP